MAITIGTSVTGNVDLSGGSGSLANVTVAAGQNMLTVRTSAPASGGPPTSMTFNGVPLTKRTEITDGNVANCSIWDLPNPSVGTYSIAITGGATCRVTATPLSGVATVTPRGTAATHGAFDANPAVTVVTEINDVVLDVVADNATMTVGAGQTAQCNNLDAFAGASSILATSTSTVMTWTAGANFECQCAIPYKPQPIESYIPIAVPPNLRAFM